MKYLPLCITVDMVLKVRKMILWPLESCSTDEISPTCPGRTTWEGRDRRVVTTGRWKGGTVGPCDDGWCFTEPPRPLRHLRVALLGRGSGRGSWKPPPPTWLGSSVWDLQISGPLKFPWLLWNPDHFSEIYTKFALPCRKGSALINFKLLSDKTDALICSEIWLRPGAVMCKWEALSTDMFLRDCKRETMN